MFRRGWSGRHPFARKKYSPVRLYQNCPFGQLRTRASHCYRRSVFMDLGLQRDAQTAPRSRWRQCACITHTRSADCFVSPRLFRPRLPEPRLTRANPPLPSRGVRPVLAAEKLRNGETSCSPQIAGPGAFLPGTVFRVESRASHRKQTVGHALTRNSTPRSVFRNFFAPASCILLNPAQPRARCFFGLRLMRRNCHGRPDAPMMSFPDSRRGNSR